MYVLIDGKPVQLGDAYGYCYLPEVYDDRGTPIGLSSAGDKVHWEVHPFCETEVEAAEWLTSRGLKGHVLRWAHHKPIEERDASYRPWVTAGIVCKVEGISLREYSPAYAEAADWAKAEASRITALKRCSDADTT